MLFVKSVTTHLLGPEGVDDGRLADIGVAHKAHTDVLLVSAHAGQLAQQAQQAALAKGVGDASMEGQARVLTTQVPQPPLGHPGWYLHHACHVSHPHPVALHAQCMLALTFTQETGNRPT